MSAGAGASVAIAAAAAHARMLAKEEEEMTQYSPQDVAQGWEFKILRSATSRFKDPAYFRQCLDEEARAGWELIEKFDDTRARLKRPGSARTRDQALGFDPYRTWVGVTQNMLGLRVALITIGGMALIVGIIVAIKNLL